jgi:hypothetical protein
VKWQASGRVLPACCRLSLVTFSFTRIAPETQPQQLHVALTDVARVSSGVGVGVLLAADSQSTSKSGYRASLWDP